jgi:hypothetical protein
MDGKPATTPATSLLLGLIGAALGGTLGYFAFGWLARQGFYALALPGALLGAGCVLLSRRRSRGLAILCGVAALVLGIFSEWRFFPFVRDGSLEYFLSHLHRLKPLTLIMIVLGGALGFWFALGSTRKRS